MTAFANRRLFVQGLLLAAFTGAAQAQADEAVAGFRGDSDRFGWRAAVRAEVSEGVNAWAHGVCLG